MTRIAIVGAGLSGRLLALNLLRRASSAVDVLMIDRGDARYMGPAYSDDDPNLLLNVPAGRMGAFSTDPEHFLNWTRDRGILAEPGDFLPRALYREYVLDAMLEARRSREDGPGLEHMRGEATDIEVGPGRARIHVEPDASVIADRVVLALGNFPPRPPSVRTVAALDSPRYVRDPWGPAALRGLARDETVFLIGTGQTTVDVVVALHARGHRGRIVAVSRRGHLPLGHRGFVAYPSFYEEIRGSTRMLELVRAVRRHVDRAEALGVDARAVIDSLRPDTQTLWLGLPDEEKRRFLRHVFRHWEVVRSRIPPQSEAVVGALRAAGQFVTIAGRVRDIVDAGPALEVHYTARGERAERVESAAVVLNCIGPELDYGRVEHPLVRNLLRRGLIRAGPARLGMDADPHGAVLDRDGVPSVVLHTLGSTMKGVLWEVLAVPEIRVQAERLAERLLAGDASRSVAAAPGTWPLAR